MPSPWSIKGTLRRLGKDSVVYGLGGAASSGIGLLLLPVYTHVFSPAAYGTITMLMVICAFLGSVLVLGMDGAQSFFFFEKKREGQCAQARMVSAILQWRLLWGSMVVTLSLALSPMVNAAFFHGMLPQKCFVAAFVGTLLAKLAGQSAEVFRLRYRPWQYLGVSLCRAVTTAALTIVLIVFLDLGVFGFFLGYAMGSAVATLVGWYGIRDYLDWSRWHHTLWPGLVRFSLPLVPGALAMYVLTTADRWFINYYHGEEVLGIYAVGAMFALGFGMIVTTFRQAWWPIALDCLQRPEGLDVFRTISRLYLGFGSAAVVLLAATSPWLTRLFSARPFHSAYPIVGVLGWSSLFFGFQLIVVGGIWKKKKTAWVALAVGAAALLNIALDACLVPRFGGLGAAVATALSFLAWNTLTVLMSERLWAVGYPFGVLGAQIGIGAAATTGVLALHQHDCSAWKVFLLTTVAGLCLGGLAVGRRHFMTGVEHIWGRWAACRE